jgi:acyl-CoA dehydrogenase
MRKLSKQEADVKLGGLTALAKAQSGIVIATCAETATLLFGGNGYTKSGQGELIESELLRPSLSFRSKVFSW